MRKLIQLMAVAILVMVGAGCASGIKYAEYKRTVPPPMEGMGRVWFYRPSAFGMAVQPAVQLDGRPVGNAVPGGFFQVETVPGDHKVKCTTEWSHETSVNVATNMDSYVRLGMMIGLFVGHVIPEEVPQARAEKEMADLRLAEPQKN